MVSAVLPPQTWLVATEEEDLSERVRHGKKGGFLRSCTVSKQSWMMMVQVRRRGCVIHRRAVCALQFHLSVNSPFFQRTLLFVPTILLRLFSLYTLWLFLNPFAFLRCGPLVRVCVTLSCSPTLCQRNYFFAHVPERMGGLQKRTAPASDKKTWPERFFVPAATNISASFTVSTTVRYIGFFVFISFLFGGRAATVTVTVCCVSEEGIPLSKVALGVSRPT